MIAINISTFLIIVLFIPELHCTNSRWTAAVTAGESTSGDQRLVNYLNNIEKQYHTILDQVNNSSAVSVCVCVCVCVYVCVQAHRENSCCSAPI